VPKTYKPKDRENLYVAYKLNGKWKYAATPFLPGQEAEAMAHARRLEAGEVIAAAAGPLTVHRWALQWLEGRGKTHDHDETALRLHILPAIGSLTLPEVRPLHIVGIIDRLKAGKKAPKTIRNVYSVMKALWRDARIMDLVQTDPCILTARQLGKVHDKDLGWRSGAVYTAEEILTLIMDERIPYHRRVLWALLAIGMLRDNEVCGLRWASVDLDMKPLGRIMVLASYDEDTTKTETERWMPIHPYLNTLLWLWKKTQWAAEHGRQPTEDDLVMPSPKPQNRGRRKPQGLMLDKDWIWKRLTRDLATLGLRHRRVHDLRRTGISLARADGADRDILKRGTHAPPKDIMGLYTSVEWEKLCAEVYKLKFEHREPVTYGPKGAPPINVESMKAKQAKEGPKPAPPINMKRSSRAAPRISRR
jgi:integrase